MLDDAQDVKMLQDNKLEELIKNTYIIVFYKTNQETYAPTRIHPGSRDPQLVPSPLVE